MIIANGKTILGGSIRSSSGLADEVHRLPPRVRYLCCAMYGAGEGNRTLDIQLGKLDSLQSYQNDSCKICTMRWLRLSEQNFRVDKWSLCRVRPPRGKAAS